MMGEFFVRRLLTASVLATLALAGASAATATAQDEALPKPVVTADDQPTWQTNGVVWALEEIDGVVYAGGTFSAVRPPGASAGTDEVPRSNFAAFDAVTGDLLPCAPSFTGGANTVRALRASTDDQRLYVGGSFASVNGTGVGSFVALDPDTCGLVPSGQFSRPGFGAAVRAIATSDTRVYVGGDFLSVNGNFQRRYAVLDTAGAVQPAQADIDLPVRTIEQAEDFGKIIVGGDFQLVDGIASRAVVALDPSSGDVVQAFPGFFPANSVAKGSDRDGTNFYMAAEGTGGGVFDGRLAANLATGALVWKDECLGATQDVAANGDLLYSVSHAHRCTNTPGGFPELNERQHLLAQSIADETIVHWFPDTDDGIAEMIGPRALVFSEGYLWVGGEQTRVNNKLQQGLTRFSPEPFDTGFVSPPALTVQSVTAGRVNISWLAGWDRDDEFVTYEIYRDGTLVHTTEAAAREWDRPTLSFTDSAPPGAQVTYRIRTSDGDNISPLGAAYTVTVSDVDVPYTGDVLEDNPLLYWTMDDTSGPTIADSAGGANPGTARGGYTLGVAGALETRPGTAIDLNGNDAWVYSDNLLSGPQEFTVELWFNTTTNRGGKLIGFGNRTTSDSSQYDRHIYMTNSGQLIFGTYVGGTRIVQSTQEFDDGQWHHAVGTLGPNGLRLYVDGELAAANASVTAAEPFSGYWKVGRDQLNSWPSRPTSNAFDGVIDEVAVYSSQLSAERVLAHFAAGRPSDVDDTQAPSAPTGVAAVVDGASVNLSWTAATDDVGVASYDVYRGTTAGFTPGASSYVTTATSTSAVDVSPPGGTVFYKVVAVDVVGNEGPPSAPVSVDVPVQATTAVLSPVEDTYVQQNLPTQNFGSGADDVGCGEPGHEASGVVEVRPARAGPGPDGDRGEAAGAHRWWGRFGYDR